MICDVIYKYIIIHILGVHTQIHFIDGKHSQKDWETVAINHFNNSWSPCEWYYSAAKKKETQRPWAIKLMWKWRPATNKTDTPKAEWAIQANICGNEKANPTPLSTESQALPHSIPNRLCQESRLHKEYLILSGWKMLPWILEACRHIIL